LGRNKFNHWENLTETHHEVLEDLSETFGIYYVLSNSFLVSFISRLRFVIFANENDVLKVDQINLSSCYAIAPHGSNKPNALYPPSVYWVTYTFQGWSTMMQSLRNACYITTSIIFTLQTRRCYICATILCVIGLLLEIHRQFWITTANSLRSLLTKNEQIFGRPIPVFKQIAEGHALCFLARAPMEIT